MSGDDSTFRGRLHRRSVIGALVLDDVIASSNKVIDAGVADGRVAPMLIPMDTSERIRQRGTLQRVRGEFAIHDVHRVDGDPGEPEDPATREDAIVMAAFDSKWPWWE